eukprot:5031858-Karenia_brevis.AAC.1
MQSLGQGSGISAPFPLENEAKVRHQKARVQEFEERQKKRDEEKNSSKEDKKDEWIGRESSDTG